LQPGGKESIGLSRYHARLVRESGGWSLIDNKSTNGTYVNSLKIAPNEPVRLKENDIVVFGGGGSQAVGARKRQKSSPFRFFFRKCAESISSPHSPTTTALPRGGTWPPSSTKKKKSTVLETRKRVGDSNEENRPSRKKKESAIVTQISDTVTCSMCLDLLVHAVNLPCGHSCCWMCWNDWSGVKKNCPTCRQEVEDDRNVIRNFCCDQMVELIVNQDSYDENELVAYKERKAESTEKILQSRKRAQSCSKSTNINSSNICTQSAKKRRMQKQQQQRNNTRVTHSVKRSRDDDDEEEEEDDDGVIIIN
jgi:hypothetical protein